MSAEDAVPPEDAVPSENSVAPENAVPSDNALERRIVEDEVRRRFFEVLGPPEIPWDDGEWDEITMSYWDSTIHAWRRFKGNLWPDIQAFWKKHPILSQVSLWTTVTVALLMAMVFLFFRPKLEPRFMGLSPWHVQRHNAWLHEQRIHESTWILDEEAQNHTSNDPSLTDEVLLQFPQRQGGSSIHLRDVRFDPKAYYGVISMKKLEEDHVPMRNVLGVGQGVRSVMGVEVIGRDIVAMTWGSQGTYMLKAWSLRQCKWSCPTVWIKSWLPGAKEPKDIPAETMRELVDMYRTVPADAMDESTTPWQQRALDDEFDMAQKEKKSKGLWYSWSR